MKKIKMTNFSKTVIMLVHFLCFSTTYAQLKVGSNPRKVKANTNFQVEGNDTTKQMVVLKTGIVGIGTVNPDTNSILDVSSSNKGFLMPRVALFGQTNPNPINTLASRIPIGLLVFNTSTVTTLGQELNPNQIYSWTGSKWDEMVTATKVSSLISQSLSGAGIPKITFKGGISGTQILAPSNVGSISSRVKFDVKTGDDTSRFNNNTRLFTIPANGLYRVTVGLNFSNNSGSTSTYTHQIEDALGISDTRILCSPCSNSISLTTVSKYTANQTVAFKLFGAGTDTAVEINGAFMIIEKLE